jgi:4-amino-4-deoxy-L-arabinose transferase-like glycosyltransferase
MRGWDLNDQTPGTWWRDFLLIAVVVGILNFFLLGRLPLANPDEGRYAEIPREMLARGDWVTPRLNETPYFEKPPLVYWTVGLSRLLFGAGEFSVRLTPALFGLGGVLLTYAAGRRMYGRIAGLMAALVLSTTLLYFVLSRILLLDMAVSVLMSATLFCFILGVRETDAARRRWLFLGLYASAALATLAKGLIGFLIPGAVMFFWLLIFHQWRRLLPMHLGAGLALFAVIAVPWHLLAAQRNPDWAQFYFVREHWERFTTTTHDRAEPAWFFIPVILAGLFPWIGFLGGAVREAVAGGWSRRRENADAWFLVTWILFIFLFFSKSQSKLIPYILPVFPALAVLIGAWLARRWGDGQARTSRVGFGIFAFACGLLGVAMLVMVFKPGAIADPVQAAALRPFGLAIAAILLLGGVVAPWAARMRGQLAGLATIFATILGFYVVLLVAAPHFQRAGTRELARVARERIPPGDAVFHYWAFFHDFVYYAERPVGLVSYIDELQVQFLTPAERAARFINEDELRRQWAGPGRVWLVVRKRDQAQPKAVFADPQFRYHLIAETRAHSLLSNQP